MNGASWGGSEELWYKTALLALKNGWTVSCAVYDWPEKKEKISVLTDFGASIYFLPNKGAKRQNFIQKTQFKITKKTSLRKATQSLLFSKHDIVVVNLGEFENTHSTWKDIYKKLPAFILLFHNYQEGQRLSKEKAEIMQSWIYHSKSNLFASKKIIEVLEKSGIEMKNGHALLNPIGFNTPLQLQEYPPLRNGSYRFVMLAALDVSRKAQDNLIKALSDEKWKLRNWTLHLYGDGKDKKVLQQLISKNNLDQKIFLHGHTSNVRRVLQEAHLLLQLTHIDAMPISVVEAMATGRPVAVSKIGDMPEWVIDGESGWVSENASVTCIDDTLEKAWQQKEKWPQIGEAAFTSFRKRFAENAEERLLEKIKQAV